MRLIAWFPVLATMGGLPCAGGSFGHCGHDPAKCSTHKRRFLDVDWPTCPVRAVIEDPVARYIRDLQRTGAVIRREFMSAWVPPALLALREELEAAEEQRARVGALGSK